MPDAAAARFPHAPLERDTRLRKAAKIASIVAARKSFSGAYVTEIGTGAGVMAAYFSEPAGPGGGVTATDVCDQRQARKGSEFSPVADTDLPFSRSIVRQRSALKLAAPYRDR